MNKQPSKIVLDAEKDYFWCSCGLSKKDPLCDGTHRECSDKTPLKFKPRKQGEAFLCTCKNTKTPPYCDGTHKEQV